MPTSQLTPRAAFAAGLTEWFRGHHFNIGLNTQTVDAEKDAGTIKKLLGLVPIQLPVPLFLSKGAGSEELFDALIPFSPHVDILASKLDYGTAIVPLVIFADSLTPQQLRRRMDEFIELAGPLTQFGPRMNGQPQGSRASLFPLLIYFERGKASRARKALLPDGYKPLRWEHIWMRVCVISVAEQAVDWAEKTGFDKIGSKVVGALGIETETFRFEESDLTAVVTLTSEITRKRTKERAGSRSAAARTKGNPSSAG
jgi:hypothetical protein